jgi:prophage regulatory protein
MGVSGKPKSSIYADIKRGTFPSPVKIGQRAVAWRESDIDAWLKSRPTAALHAGGGPTCSAT